MFKCVCETETLRKSIMFAAVQCVCVCVCVCLPVYVLRSSIYDSGTLSQTPTILSADALITSNRPRRQRLSHPVCVCVCVFMVYLQGISREFLITSVLCLLAHWKGHKYTLPADIILTHTHTHRHTHSVSDSNGSVVVDTHWESRGTDGEMFELTES